MASISISAPPGSLAAWMQVLAGFGVGKSCAREIKMRIVRRTDFEFTFSYTSFMAAKWSMSMRYTLTLTTFSQEDPTASKTSARLEMHCAYAQVNLQTFA